jgi:WD40 repeat protein
MHLFVIAAVLACQETAEDAFKKIEENVLSANTIRASWHEDQIKRRGDADWKASGGVGRLILKQGNKVICADARPVLGMEHHIEFVTNGVQAWSGGSPGGAQPPVECPKNVEAQFRRMLVHFYPLIFLFNPATTDVAKAYQVSELKQGPDEGKIRTITFALLFMENSKFTEKLWYDPETHRILRREIIAPDGRRYLISFDEFTLGDDIKDELFSPDGAPHLPMGVTYDFESEWQVKVVAFSGNGRLLVTHEIESVPGTDQSYFRTLNIWEPATGKKLGGITSSGGGFTAACFSPDSTILAAGNREGWIALWDVATGNEIRRFRGHEDGILSLAYAPDGKQVAASSFGCKVHLLSPETGKELRVLEDGPESDAACSRPGRVRGSYPNAYGGSAPSPLAFTPEGTKLAMGGLDGRFRIWSCEGGKPLLSIAAHKRSIQSLAFSPDGSRLATYGKDSRVSVWETSAGKEIYTRVGPPETFGHSIIFSPNGKQLLMGSGYGTGLDAVTSWGADFGKDQFTVKQGGQRPARTSVLAFTRDGQVVESASDNLFFIQREATTGKSILWRILGTDQGGKDYEDPDLTTERIMKERAARGFANGPRVLWPDEPKGKGSGKPTFLPNPLDKWERQEIGGWYRFRLSAPTGDSILDEGLKGRDDTSHMHFLLSQTFEKGQAGPINQPGVGRNYSRILGEATLRIQGRAYLCNIYDIQGNEKHWLLKEGRFAGADLRSEDGTGTFMADTLWENTVKIKGRDFECLVVEGNWKGVGGGGNNTAKIKTWFCPLLPVRTVKWEREGTSGTLIDFGKDWSQRPPFQEAGKPGTK